MKNKKMMPYIHYLIGLAIMVGFKPLLNGLLPNVTEVGYGVLGVFIGTLYLWTTIDPTTSSLTCIFMLAFTGFAPAGGVLAGTFGNPIVIQLLFIMIFMGGLTNRKLTVYIARWIMTRKFIEGKPWIFTFVMLLGTFMMAAFVNSFAPIFLFWPVLYGVFDDVGFTKKDKYPRIMLIAVVIAALIGFPVPPYMGNGLALLGNYRGLVSNNFKELLSMSGVMISDASYFTACFIMGIVLLIIVVLVMKYLFRPDVSPLKKISVEMLEKNPLPPMNKAQKIYLYSLFIFIFVMLVPSLFPTLPILSFLNANSLIVAFIMVTILAFIQTEDGPVLKFNETMGRDFAWPTFWLCTAAIYIGGVLTNEATGVTPFLNTVLSPIFSGMSGATFTIFVLLMAVVLTNVCNSLVIGMILQPVILTYCVGAGVNPAPIITLLIFTVLLSAAVTPAASPFAAMMFGNKEWLSSADVYKYATIFVAVELIVILALGVPFVNLLV